MKDSSSHVGMALETCAFFVPSNREPSKPSLAPVGIMELADHIMEGSQQPTMAPEVLPRAPVIDTEIERPGGRIPFQSIDK
ncbi:hypothetical protein FBZ93_1113 [Bradyrhizobium macuxiense]|uniref:Uncharacterized protein n=1 Tax=Bradyrhizobium macuxiense TaxID=1755647 RepID=A0A560LEV3_9BRAD|nr:hypothetical protein [Bradyrhizobium macuxiense]TWB92964.1 hypothetical protein FBZ93_1113 [Bradyrhizobium macuxiense]